MLISTLMVYLSKLKIIRAIPDGLEFVPHEQNTMYRYAYDKAVNLGGTGTVGSGLRAYRSTRSRGNMTQYT